MFRKRSHPTFLISSFFGWLGAHLRHESASDGAFIYREGDAIHEIFILQKGLAGYFLVKYNSYFAMVEPGDMFGHIDYKQAKKNQIID